jgi:hypothetical protein
LKSSEILGIAVAMIIRSCHVVIGKSRSSIDSGIANQGNQEHADEGGSDN